MLTVRPRYQPMFAPHRVQQTARVGGVFTGAGAVVDRLAWSALAVSIPMATGAIVFGTTGLLVGAGVGFVIAAPILFGG